ncbi:MAG: putative polyketide cyclase/dehydrase [Acidimicrobiaceae bacterium]|nr:putative polyketide cyclase/dehydrase [Acidimicrobiaceae bacterium]
MWRVLRDPAQLPTWFRTVQSARVVDDLRHLTLKRGGQVTERLLTVDDELRRFRYGVESGLPLESHLGTVDVIAVRPGQSLVVYAADVEPAGAASGFDRSIEGALVCLKELVESETS